MSTERICGELLYTRTNAGEYDATHYCTETWGVEHDHDNATRQTLTDGTYQASVFILNGEVAQINVQVRT